MSINYERKIRQANELIKDSLNTLNSKLPSYEDFFRAALKYDVALTIKNYCKIVYHSIGCNSVCAYLLRRLLELKAINELEKRGEFKEVNYKLFKKQALKNIGEKEITKFSSELHIKPKVLKNMLSIGKYTPCYLIGIISNYDSSYSIVYDCLSEDEIDFFNTLGVYIHNSTPICENRVFSKLNFNKQIDDLLLYFDQFLKPFKRLEKYDHKDLYNVRDYIEKFNDFDRDKHNFYVNDAILLDFRELIDELMNLFNLFNEKEDKRFIYISLKVVYEKLALFVKGLSYYDEIDFDYVYRTFLDVFTYNVYNLNDVDKISKKEIEERLEKISKKYNKSITIYKNECFKDPQYVLFNRVTNYKSNIGELLDTLNIENKNELLSSYESIVSDGHATLYSAFMSDFDIDKDLKEGIDLLFISIEYILNFYMNLKEFKENPVKNYNLNQYTIYKQELYLLNENLKKIKEIILNNFF